MDQSSKELFLYSILAGKQIIKYKNQKFILKNPNVDILNEANYVYKELVESAEKFRLFDKEDIINLLIDQKELKDSDIELMNSFNSRIEGLQLKLYESRKNAGLVEDIKSGLETLRKQNSKIYSTLSKYYHFTVDGFASYGRNLFIIENTLYHEDKLIPFEKTLYDFVTANQLSIDTRIIREIVKTAPWANMWIGLKQNGVIFPDGINTSVDQQLLLMWSRVYDSLHEGTEPPEDDVIKDDDMLDGWFLSRKKDKPKQDFQKYEEVFIVAKNKEDIERIKSMNSKIAQNIKQRRFKEIEQKGEVHHAQLPDVKENLIIQHNNLYRNNMKAK